MLSNCHLQKTVKRTKKAIPHISRVSKLIAITILIIISGDLAFSWLFSWSGLLPMLASIGGMIVFLGLWIEKEAEIEDRKIKHPQFSKRLSGIKFKSEIGWVVLMCGIVSEIFLGGALAAFEWYENDPWNGTVSEVSADVYLETNLTNNDSESTWHPPNPAALLILGMGRPAFSNGVPIIHAPWSILPSLAATSFLHLGTFPDKNIPYDHISYSMHFSPDGMVAVPGRVPVPKISDVHCLWIEPCFIPTNCEVEGLAKVVVNGKLTKLFWFPKQKLFGQPPMRTLIATNFSNQWN